MTEDRQELCEQLDTANTSLGFLLLIIVSVLLSYIATARQREALCLALAGDEARAEQVGNVYPLRLGASALIVGALGYFFCLTLKNCCAADCGDPVAVHSARMNVIAGFLVLLASLIRLFDLNFTQHAQSATAEELLPD